MSDERDFFGNPMGRSGVFATDGLSGLPCVGGCGLRGEPRGFSNVFRCDQCLHAAFVQRGSDLAEARELLDRLDEGAWMKADLARDITAFLERTKP